MSEGRCGTCRFWQDGGSITDITGKEKRVAGLCGGIGSTWDWRLDDPWPLPASSERALLIDSNAVLLTTADFGCASWEGK